MSSQKHYDTGKLFLGFCETLNPNAGINENQVPPKVVILKKEKNDFKPVKDYEYYYCRKIVPLASFMTNKEISWFIREDKISQVITRTGLEEASVINKPENPAKILRKVA